MISNIDNIIEFIKRSNDFVVTSHISPDGDNIGSTLGVYYLLKKLGKKVYYVLDDNAPLNLEFLVENVYKMSSEEFKALNIDNYSLIALDCGDKRRICVSEEIKEKALKVVCIDHHASNDFYGDLNYIDAKASSTSELVYNLIARLNELDNINIIDEDIATALYTGLITDTGNFSYSSTHPSSFEMAKELIILGAKKDKIIQNVFQSNSYNYYKLLGEALNTLDIVNEKVACISLTIDMLKRNNMSFNDVDGITNYTRDIKDIEVGILLKQKKENEVKVSLRSKSYVNVSKIAHIFNGGGHVRAAGCTIYDTVENAKIKILQEVLKEI